MNNLTQRICSAAVLILILVVLIHPATTIPIKATAIGFISLIILWEYSRLFKSRFIRIFFQILFVGLFLSAPYLTEFLEKTSNYFLGFLCLLWLLISFQVLTYKKKNISDSLIFIFGYFILLPFVASLFFMVMNPGIFLYVVIVVSIADSAAFFVGRTMGKTSLLPNISPGKTIEGFIGGVLIASIFSCLIALFRMRWEYLLSSSSEPRSSNQRGWIRNRQDCVRYSCRLGATLWLRWCAADSDEIAQVAGPDLEFIQLLIF